MKIKPYKNDENINKKLFNDFKIPYELKYDLTYCQVFLRHYIKVHQLWTIHCQNCPDDTFAEKCLVELENDIRDIGEEQKNLSEKLRSFALDYYKKLVNDKRRFDSIKEYGDAVVSIELYNTYVYVTLTKLNKSTLFEPINVQRRKTSAELISKFKLKTYRTPSADSKRKSKSNHATDNYSPLEPIVQITTDASRSLASSPTIVANTTNATSLKTYENVKQISLLKPISERLSSSNTSLDEAVSQQSSTIKKSAAKTMGEPKKPPSPPKQSNENTSINSSRLNLFNALKKARLATTNTPPNKSPPSSTNSSPISSGMPSPVAVANSPEPQTDSQNNNDLIEYEDPVEEEEVELDQEQFLRLFGLYTLEKSVQITSKRRERRRRNVQSTERVDYHYGRFDFYEPKPQPLSRRKKPILYSPPATRALKKRKGSDEGDNGAVKPKNICSSLQAAATSGSTSSGSTNGVDKPVGCNTCFIRNGEKLNKCQNCSQLFHMKCHKNVFSAQSLRARENVCPNCFRQQQKQLAAVNTHIRDLKLRDRLILKNEQLSQEKEKLAIKLEIIENKYYLNLSEKENLCDDEFFLKNKMKNLMNTIGMFKN